jgi:hypothetical protein
MGEGEQSSLTQRVVSAIAVCGFALLAVLAAPLLSAVPRNWPDWLKDWLPPRASQQQEGTQAPQVPQPPVVAWTDKEIKTALAQCVQALAPIAADVSPLGPIRSGDCGTAAPVLVKSIGGAHRVSFDPPLILDCAMVAGLDRWLKESVQPAARKVFSSSVSKIIGSSYACRNVYNLPNGHLSQHAFANAVDLPLFVLANGRKVDVTHGWGPTQRDLIAAKANEKSTKGSVSDVVRISTTPAQSAAAKVKTGDESAADPKAAAEGKFLRLAHDGGCKIFSTVLGPEYNDVHRTHFHLDLQDRRTAVCR